LAGRSIALIWMLAASAFFVLQAVAYKLATQFLPPFEMMVIRNSGALLLLWLWQRSRGRRIRLPVNRSLLLLRGVFGTLGMICYFYGLHLLPMAEVVVIHKTAPFIILVLAAIFMGEKITRTKMVGFLIAMAGVAVVFRPGIQHFGLVLFLPLAAAVFSGAAHASIRKLNETEDPTTIVSGFFLISLPLLIPLMMGEGVQVPDSGGQWFLVFSVGFLTVLAQICMTYAYRVGEAGEVALYSYASIPLAALFGLVIFGDVPDTGTIAGSIMIIAAAALVAGKGRLKTSRTVP